MNLWLRFQCWNNGICYKHATEKQDIFYYDGHCKYCVECEKESVLRIEKQRQEAKDRAKQLIERINAKSKAS